MSIIASIFLWPYFAPSLAIVAIVYLIFVNRAANPVVRHPAVAIVAWAALALCVSTLAVTLGYGAVEIYIRTEIAKGITGVPRNTPDDATRPQRPLFSGSRELTPDQIRILIVEFSKIKEFVPTISIYTPPMDNEAYSIFRQLNDIFQRAGINTQYGGAVPLGIDDVGISLRVRHADNMSKGAQKLKEAFEVANIHLHITEWNSDLDVIYIGPRPRLCGLRHADTHR